MKDLSKLIKPHDLVKVKQINNEVIIHNINNCNKHATIKRLKGHRHVILSTGEIVEENRNVKRGDNQQSLRESNESLKLLIKANTLNTNHLLVATFTYGIKMTDRKKAYEDFKNFIKRLRNEITEFGKIEYINTFALHSDKKRYHIHAILFFNESTKRVYIDRLRLQKIWGHGFADIKGVKNNNDVYFYLTPHISKEVSDKNEHMNKNALLQMELPAGTNLYHYSRGIKKPEEKKMLLSEIEQKLKQENYKRVSEQVYASPLQAYYGNTLYYYRLHYKKAEQVENSPPKRTPV